MPYFSPSTMSRRDQPFIQAGLSVQTGLPFPCPRCGENNWRKNGKRGDGRVQYKCLACKVSTPDYSLPARPSKKIGNMHLQDGKLILLAKDIMAGFSCRDSARRQGVDQNTAYKLRKFLIRAGAMKDSPRNYDLRLLFGPDYYSKVRKGKRIKPQNKENQQVK